MSLSKEPILAPLLCLASSGEQPMGSVAWAPMHRSCRPWSVTLPAVGDLSGGHPKQGRPTTCLALTSLRPMGGQVSRYKDNAFGQTSPWHTSAYQLQAYNQGFYLPDFPFFYKMRQQYLFVWIAKKRV